MRTANCKARLLVAGLAFFFAGGPTVSATSHIWDAQNVSHSEWGNEDAFFIDYQEALACDSGGQLVQTNKLSSDLSTIQLELIIDTYCELTLHDLKGNSIQAIEAEQKKKGKHLVLWKHTDVPAGTYSLTLCTDHRYEQIKVVLD